MKVCFKNNYFTKVWVAIMRFDPDSCGGEGGNFATEGWWEIVPGGEVWAFSTTNQFAYFFAEAEDGAVWNGPFGPVSIYAEAFSSCLNIGSTASTGKVGMQEFELPWFRTNPLATHTVNLNS